jgi:hypothetical protein
MKVLAFVGAAFLLFTAAHAGAGTGQIQGGNPVQQGPPQPPSSPQQLGANLQRLSAVMKAATMAQSAKNNPAQMAGAIAQSMKAVVSQIKRPGTKLVRRDETPRLHRRALDHLVRRESLRRRALFERDVGDFDFQKLLTLLETSPGAQQATMNAVNNDPTLLLYLKQLMEAEGQPVEGEGRLTPQDFGNALNLLEQDPQAQNIFTTAVSMDPVLYGKIMMLEDMYAS